MSTYRGTNNSETINISGWDDPAPSNPDPNLNYSHRVLAFGGHDTVTGSDYKDIIDGGEGNDRLYGGNGNDILIGGTGIGSDRLYGENGDDLLAGGDGKDQLRGGAGNDTLWGGAGDDRYYFNRGEGIDIINDDKSTSGASGHGGGVDSLYFGEKLHNIVLDPQGDDLYIYSKNDVNDDGIVTDYVIIEDHFSNPDNTLEKLYFQNDTGGWSWQDLNQDLADYFHYPDAVL